MEGGWEEESKTTHMQKICQGVVSSRNEIMTYVSYARDDEHCDVSARGLIQTSQREAREGMNCEYGWCDSILSWKKACDDSIS